MVALLVLAHAAAADRDPLPARELERPVVLPRGWTHLGLDLRLEPEGHVRRDVARLAAAVGLLPRAEVYVALPVVRARVGELDVLGAGDPVIGGRASLLRREPPNRSLALDVWARAPHDAVRRGIRLGAGVPAAAATVVGRAQFAGLGVDAAAGGLLEGGRPGVLARGRSFVQAGPLVPGVSVIGTWLDAVDAELEAEARLQASRGLSLAGAWSWPVVGTGARAVSLRVETWL